MEFAEKTEKIRILVDEAITIAKEYPEFKDLEEKLVSEISDKKSEESLRIVFVGQYSSGKSSIIRALTDDDSIKIDSDVATDQPRDYFWKSVKITDTPGIQSGHTDHDEKAHQRIKHADLIVYVITYSLFDNYLLEDFKRLAIDYNYKNKIVLVVNKMYSENGEYQELCETYKNSLKSQIGEGTVDSIPICFISAANALDEDPDFHPYSHMDDLTNELDALVEKNQSLGGVEAIGRIVASSIEEVLSGNFQKASGDEHKLLLRVENAIKRTKDDAERSLREQTAGITSLARRLGSECSANIGVSDEVQQEIDESVEKLQNFAEKSTKELEEYFGRLDEELEQKLSELGNSPLAEKYFSKFENEEFNVQTSPSAEGNYENVDAEHKVAKSLGNLVGKGATGVGKLSTGAQGGSGLLTSSAATGSSTHQAVLSAGKTLGVKFRPWQAVNIAKYVGNASRVLGAITAALPAILEVYDVVQEKNREKELADARRKVREGFQDAGNDIVKDMEKNGKEFIESKYGAMINEISSMRRERISEEENLEEGGEKLKQVSDEIRKIV